jgi:hypothetical protein
MIIDCYRVFLIYLIIYTLYLVIINELLPPFFLDRHAAHSLYLIYMKGFPYQIKINGEFIS